MRSRQRRAPLLAKLARLLPADRRESCCLIGIAPTGAS
jgi:hypothetical protein